ncbi:MAG: hypothetical protein ACI8ZB_002672 [Desulforhopalus sp.]|jgi:uncharacterized protein (TIGR04255 family)
MSKLPTKISPEPLAEAIFELRFKSNFPADAIFGVIYNEFKDDYPGKVEQLPVLQLPAEIRKNDQNLKYSPYYAIKHENSVLQIGPRAISLSIVNNYPGWTDFFKTICNIYQKLLKTNLLEDIERTSVRYVNIFEKIDVSDFSTIKVSLKGRSLIDTRLNLSTTTSTGDCTSVLRISNDVNANVNNKIVKGSAIDIDTFIVNVNKEDFETSIKRAHSELKELFFSCLSDEFLASLNPVS